MLYVHRDRTDYQVRGRFTQLLSSVLITIRVPPLLNGGSVKKKKRNPSPGSPVLLLLGLSKSNKPGAVLVMVDGTVEERHFVTF